MTDAVDHYSYAIDPDGDATANKVLRLVGENKNVLELGCGSGTMTQYMQQQLGGRVTAIELDPASAEQARPYCQQLLVANLDEIDLSETFTGRDFDVIVAADVLEHLRDPWRCLRSARGLLRDHGYLVVSVPNIAHNVIIAQLLAGRFPYTEKGLLDRTHLRFFTRQDIEELLLQTGFLPSHWERSLTAETDTEFAQAWLQTPPELREAMAQSPDGRTYQFVIKAYPSGEAGWVQRTRNEITARDAQLRELEQTLTRTETQLREHQQAFAEARQVIANQETALAEYAEAFSQARDDLGERAVELDKVYRAFDEARQTLQRLEQDNKALRNARSMRLARRLKSLLGGA